MVQNSAILLFLTLFGLFLVPLRFLYTQYTYHVPVCISTVFATLGGIKDLQELEKGPELSILDYFATFGLFGVLI